MEMALRLPGTFTRTGPPSDRNTHEQPGVDPFDVAWTLSTLVYALAYAARVSGHA